MLEKIRKAIGLDKQKKEEKGAPLGGHHSNLMEANEAEWKSINGKAYAKEGYIKNVIAYRCVKIIAESLSAIPLRVMVGEEEASEDHPLVKLLKNPNPLDSGSDFFEYYTAYRLIDGNAYMELMNGSMTGQPTELWLWDPFNMSIIARKSERVPRGYRWTDGSNKHEWPFEPSGKGDDTIMHWRSFNPLKRFSGMSPMEPGAMSIDQHNESSEWNMRSLQNSGVPSGMFMNEGQGLQGPQLKEIREEINLTHQGPKNARKIMVLPGKLKYQQLSQSPVDMDFLNTHKNSAEEIAAAYGVPLQMIPISESQTFSNYQQAELSFYKNTVIPLLKELIANINKDISPRYSEDTKVYFNRNDIDALAQERVQIMKDYDEISFLTDNEKRKANDIEEYEDPAADLLYQDASKFPLGSLDLTPEEEEKMTALTIMDIKGLPMDQALKEARAIIQSQK